MSYEYHKADTYNVSDDEIFFFDANIWIKILQPTNSKSYKDKGYLKLFNSILQNKTCKIAVSSLIFSEIINRILREVYMNKYIKSQNLNPDNIDRSYYKNVFRSSPEFQIAYNLITDDIKSYDYSLLLVNDEFGSKINFSNILNNPPASLDFNDFYYYNLCKLGSYSFVTDDKDFWVEDIKIITMNDTLYNKYIAQILSSKNPIK